MVDNEKCFNGLLSLPFNFMLRICCITTLMTSKTATKDCGSWCAENQREMAGWSDLVRLNYVDPGLLDKTLDIVVLEPIVVNVKFDFQTQTWNERNEV